MTLKTKSHLIRCAVFLVLAVLLFVFVRPFMYRSRTRLGHEVALKDVGVEIMHSPDGSTTIKVDNREETVPKGQLGSSALLKEATERIASRTNAQIGQQYSEFRLRRFVTWWLCPTVLLYFLIFQLPPRRPYIEGSTE